MVTEARKRVTGTVKRDGRERGRVATRRTRKRKKYATEMSAYQEERPTQSTVDEREKEKRLVHAAFAKRQTSMLFSMQGRMTERGLPTFSP